MALPLIPIATMALASVACAMAQDIPPLAPLRGDGATLKDTMKFIEDMFSSKVTYALYGHNNITGTDSQVIRKSYEDSNVSGDV